MARGPTTSDDESSRPQAKRQKYLRTRTGCLACRRRKIKCDDKRPTCGWCKKRKKTCQWGVELKFRDENAHKLGSDHPSMILASRRRPGGYEIVNITAEVISDYHNSLLSVRAIGADDESVVCDSPDHVACGSSHLITGAATTAQKDLASSFDRVSNSESMGFVCLPPLVDASSTSVLSPLLTSAPAPPVAQRRTDSAVANLIYFSQGGDRNETGDPVRVGAEPVSMGLLADYLDHGQPYTPNGHHEDGIFLPGSAYHELHATLRQHLIQEVRSNVPMRPATSRTESNIANAADYSVDIVHDELLDCIPENPVARPLVKSRLILSQHEECHLWRNWFDEVAPWLDKFDNHRHFQYTLPTLASTNDHLRYSVLALSARQQELKDKARSTDRSLALYQEAIHLLLPNLASRSSAIIASCVILCVLEMLSCSPKAWQRHLDGCANLMEAVGIHGFVGGVDQALFWCFARMDVCGGLISSVSTLIPVSQWAPEMDVGNYALISRFAEDFAGWANFAIYLTAQVLSLLAPVSDMASLQVSKRADPLFQSRWLKLWKQICDWLENRPAALLPVMTIPSSDSSPFPTIIFSNPAAISGNQMYHTASLLMLQNQPPDVTLPQKPRSFCGMPGGYAQSASPTIITAHGQTLCSHSG
ncbi:hypothetical protein QQS21_002951 [Conoideocrella luteorostrata]|uniref:Zn(2)-C6 fungal-type domain-containing protein n=1 Tax=Conoideocrella luteorostrata TaxID=1105319 RepID=A0AAJ0CU52_9HYPO|nr:hypothetical protein QQS21_002951 [Conoideocrella luteorostrata]